MNSDFLTLLSSEAHYSPRVTCTVCIFVMLHGKNECNQTWSHDNEKFYHLSVRELIHSWLVCLHPFAVLAWYPKSTLCRARPLSCKWFSRDLKRLPELQICRKVCETQEESQHGGHLLWSLTLASGRGSGGMVLFLEDPHRHGVNIHTSHGNVSKFTSTFTSLWSPQLFNSHPQDVSISDISHHAGNWMNGFPAPPSPFWHFRSYHPQSCLSQKPETQLVTTCPGLCRTSPGFSLAIPYSGKCLSSSQIGTVGIVS